MALNGIGSCLSTMSEFSAHWASVNVELGGTPATELKLQGGFTRAMFETLRADLGAAIPGLENLENAREIAAADRDQEKFENRGDHLTMSQLLDSFAQRRLAC